MLTVLFTNTLLVTCLCLLLIVSRNNLLRWFGAKATYSLWCVVPLSLIVFNLPQLSANGVTSENFYRVVVLAQQSINETQSQYGVSFWAVWLTGGLLLLILMLFQYWTFTRSLVLTPINQYKAGKEVCLQGKGKLSVYVCKNTGSPALTGVWRTKLLLPSNFFSDFNECQRNMMLEHEFCHYQRKDLYWNLVAAVILISFWFNPVVWIALGYFKRDQELACDETVLQRKSASQCLLYSKAMFQCAQQSQASSLLHTPFADIAKKHALVERVQSIRQLNNTLMSPTYLFVAIAVVLVLVCAALSYVVGPSQLTSMTLLEPIKRIAPKYPMEAANNRVEGEVVLMFNVNRHGGVEAVRVDQSIPQNVFEHNAVAAFKQWRYKPQGVPLKNQKIRMDFRLAE